VWKDETGDRLPGNPRPSTFSRLRSNLPPEQAAGAESIDGPRGNVDQHPGGAVGAGGTMQVSRGGGSPQPAGGQADGSGCMAACGRLLPRSRGSETVPVGSRMGAPLLQPQPLVQMARAVEETQGKGGNHSNLDTAVAVDEESKPHETSSQNSLNPTYVHRG